MNTFLGSFKNYCMRKNTLFILKMSFEFQLCQAHFLGWRTLNEIHSSSPQRPKKGGCVKGEQQMPPWGWYVERFRCWGPESSWVLEHVGEALQNQGDSARGYLWIDKVKPRPYFKFINLFWWGNYCPPILVPQTLRVSLPRGSLHYQNFRNHFRDILFSNIWK